MIIITTVVTTIFLRYREESYLCLNSEVKSTTGRLSSHGGVWYTRV